MSSLNERRLADQVEFLKTINATQAQTINNKNKQIADLERLVKILKGRKA